MTRWLALLITTMTQMILEASCDFVNAAASASIAEEDLCSAGVSTCALSLAQKQALLRTAAKHDLAELGSTLETPQHQRLAAAKPIAWVHIPKTGSSFINALLHHKGICPDWPDNQVLGSGFSLVSKPSNHTEDAYELTSWVFPPDVRNQIQRSCAGGFSTLFPQDFENLGNHQGINGHIYNQVQGHFMTFVRQPEQRILSAWSAGWGRHTDDAFSQTARNWGVVEFAKKSAGCQVKMLARGGKPCKLRYGDDPSAHEVELAKKRLREGFAFVGLTDRWEVSISLFHKMFGGPCIKSDFVNNRPSSDGSNPRPSVYDTAALQGFVDIHDGALYDEATAIFEENVKKYNANNDAACFASMA